MGHKVCSACALKSRREIKSCKIIRSAFSMLQTSVRCCGTESMQCMQAPGAAKELEDTKNASLPV